MKQRKLGALTVSAIGFGCMGLSHAYGTALEKDTAIQRIREAVDAGYTLFDTAEVYVGKFADGSDAVNEELVGEALRPVRDQVIIATKGGIRWGTNHQVVPDGSPAFLRRSLEQSLKRLGVETIDLYYQHHMDPNTPPEVVAETMAQFIQEGKIRTWGISNASTDYIRRADMVCKVAAVQERYSMMARWTASLFPLLEERDIGFVAFSPLANGFLSGGYSGQEHFDKALDFRSRMPQYTEHGAQKAEKLTALLGQISKNHHATPAQVSLAWMLGKKPWIVPIPGTTKRERLWENADAAALLLTAEEQRAIDDLLDTLNLEVFGQ